MLRHFDPRSGLRKICIVLTPIFEEKLGKCRISTPIFWLNLAKCIVSTPLFRISSQVAVLRIPLRNPTENPRVPRPINPVKMGSQQAVNVVSHRVPLRKWINFNSTMDK